MTIEKLLSKKRTAILKSWFQVIIDTYPPETAQFLKKEKDPFANPVGRSIRDGIDGIFDQLVSADSDMKEATPFLDNIIRVRAVQDFSPSAALSFIFALKDVVAEQLKDEIEAGAPGAELAVLFSRIDRLALLAFDVYAACREQLCQIRVKEADQRAAQFLERANALWERREGKTRVSEE